MIHFFQKNKHSKILKIWNGYLLRNMVAPLFSLPLLIFCGVKLCIGMSSWTEYVFFGLLFSGTLIWFFWAIFDSCWEVILSLIFFVRLSKNEMLELEREFEDVYEHRSRELGIITRRGVVFPDGFAPWEYMKAVQIRSSQMDVGASVLQGITIDPCQVTIVTEVKVFNIPLKYTVGKRFNPNRDMSSEIEQFIEAVIFYTHGRVRIDNDYYFKH